MLEDMGVQYAFGVSGGAIASGGGFRIAPLWHALQHSDIRVLHIHHETGAAFAATEAYFASGCPVVAFTTTGLGITNALTTQIFLQRRSLFYYLSTQQVQRATSREKSLARPRSSTAEWLRRSSEYPHCNPDKFE
jgi:isopropylmalate/homocitrate/citramalate synthase